jgi:nucleoside-diphosphate-sugar epimerase
MRKAFVTGGTGFLGRRLVEKLSLTCEYNGLNEFVLHGRRCQK